MDFGFGFPLLPTRIWLFIGGLDSVFPLPSVLHLTVSKSMCQPCLVWFWFFSVPATGLIQTVEFDHISGFGFWFSSRISRLVRQSNLMTDKKPHPSASQWNRTASKKAKPVLANRYFLSSASLFKFNGCHHRFAKRQPTCSSLMLPAEANPRAWHGWASCQLVLRALRI